MSKNSGSSLKLLGWMDSLADATRLRLMRLLESHELNVMDLCDILQLPQSTVSRHLKILGDQQWCHARREGTHNLYRMTLGELEPTMRKLWLLAREQTESWAALHQDALRLEARLLSRQSESQAFFADSANQWDRLRQEMYGPNCDLQAHAALLPADWTVADLGCGNGAATAQLARSVHQVIGIDQSQAMLQAARQRTAKLDNVELRLGDLQDIPIEDDRCDGAILTLVLTYLDSPATVLKQTHRIVKPGGRVAIVDILRHDRDDFRRQMGQRVMGYAVEDVCKMLHEAGFEQIKVLELSPHPQAKGPALFSASATVASANHAIT